MEHSADELCAPAWLNDDFFRLVIREFTHDKGAQLCHSCRLRPGTKPGEHLASVMYRTTIHYRSSGRKEAALAVIVKIKPFQEGLKKKNVLSDDDLFVREMRVYSQVLPQMARRLKEIGETINHPRLVYAAEAPHTILILEDVSGSGWQTGPYLTSLQEALPAIKIIAKFHAASVVIQHENPSFSTEYQCRAVEKFRALDGMLKKSFHDLLQFMRSTDGFEQLVSPVEKLQQTLLEELVVSYGPSTGCLNVLVHGDFHSKNLLHQYTDGDGQISDTMLVDYQICSWTTPAVDLYYLLDTIVDQSLKERHREEMIHLYHAEFSSLLRRLGYLGRVTSLLELQVELLQKGALELFHYVALYPFRFVDRSKIDFEQLLSGTAQNPAASSPVYRQVMRAVLTRFLHQGVMRS